jgi:hypothetical protein
MGLLAAALAAAAGCQSNSSPYNFAPVEGTVSKDGKPLAGVLIVFCADAAAGTQGPNSTGATDSAGHYRLHTHQGVDGAIVGRHRVCILDKEALARALSHNPASRMAAKEGRASGPSTEPKDGPASGPSDVPPGYTRREQTPLRAEVRPGAQVLDFEVK